MSIHDDLLFPAVVLRDYNPCHNLYQQKRNTMKIAIITALFAGSAAAFAPVTRPAFSKNNIGVCSRSFRCVNRYGLTRFSLTMIHSATSLEAQSTRGEFMAQLAGVVAAGAAFPGVASAAQYGGVGRGSPNVLDPKDAIIDEEIFKSSEVQRAIEAIKSYSATVGEMKKALEANGQVDLGPVVRKQFDFVKLRSDLNTFNSAFDEDTQKGTDKLVRVILQDLTELETANKQKEGIERSERRIGNMMAKIDKLQLTFDNFLKFAN